MIKKHADKKATDTAAEPALDAVPPSLTQDELEHLRADAAKATENWDKLLRATADFENFKKRAARERQDGITYANASLFQKLIPVLDNFEMALAATVSVPDAATQSMQAGVKMIASQFRAALIESGLEEIDAAGKPFDPNFHEAVSQQDTADVPEGYVAQQLRKGFKLRDRLLRPATVIVARKPQAPSAPAGS